MEYLDFEKHIRKELEGSKETVQMDALLASLNLGKDPKRKGFTAWKIIPFLILALSVFAWKYMDNFTINTDKTHLSKQAFSKTETNNEIIDPSNSNQISNTIEVQEDPPAESNLITPTAENAKKTTKTNLNPISEDIQKINSTSSVNDLPPADNKSHVQSFTNSTTNTNLGIVDRMNEDTEVNSYNISSNLRTTSSEEIKESKSFTALGSKASRNILTIADLEKSLSTLENQEIDGNLFSRMKINCPSFDNIGWHMALIPEVGIFYPSKTLANKSNEESFALTERLNSETTLEGIELGLYGMLVRDNMPIYLKAGVSYSRISERMDLKYEYAVQDTSLGIISSTVSANGDTITHIYGDIITETTFKGSNRQHYYIHLFDVPISIGYTTYLGGLDVGIEGGVKVNFMTRATGNLLTSQKDYTNLSLNRLFKNRIGLSYFGGLMIGRNFGKFGDFYLAPRFTYYPNEFNNQNNSISQKYFTIGLNAGVVYKIN